MKIKDSPFAGPCRVWEGGVRVRRTCIIEGCGKARRTSGLCQMHRARVIRHGTTDDQRPLLDPEWKTCSRCGARKRHVEFHIHPRARDGRRGSCKACFNEVHKQWNRDNPARFRTVTKAWLVANPESAKVAKKKHYKKNRLALLVASRDYNVKTKYGLTRQEVAEMAERQGHRCLICRSTFKNSRSTHIDHCHKTGVVRGLLCGGCNTGLGHFKDDPLNLLAAIGYLSQGREVA